MKLVKYIAIYNVTALSLAAIGEQIPRLRKAWDDHVGQFNN